MKLLGLNSRTPLGRRAVAPLMVVILLAMNVVTAGANGEPSARHFPSMAFDSATGSIVLFGGYNTPSGSLGDTWAWNSGWTQQNPTTSPCGRYQASMAYDAATSTVVLFGGGGTLCGDTTSDTWTWNGTTWTQQAPGTSPRGRDLASMAYDPALGKVFMFGGIGTGSTFLSDTWTWDGSTWTNVSAGPWAAAGTSMAYDAATGQLILFTGGQGVSGGFSNNTYVWSGSGWSELLPAQSPSPRGYATMAYDAALGKLVLFGGENSTSVLGDMWTWDGSNWSQINPINPPTPRMAAGMAYDDAAGKLVLFGGSTNNPTLDTGVLGDTWTWDQTSWSSSPYSPANVVATPGNGTATVTWSPPTNNGGSPITGYTVTANPGGASVTVSAPATTASFSGLTSDCRTTYSFTVTANNAVGGSPASPPSNSVMPSGHPTNPPSVAVILVGGVNSSMPNQNVYDPLSVSYCGLKTAILPPNLTDLKAMAQYFDLQSTLVPDPPLNLTDSIATTGAVILPFSYRVASFGKPPGCRSLLTANPYTSDMPGSVPTDLEAQILNAEVQSIHCLWPTTNIEIIGHSQGGLVAETYWQNYVPTNPAPVTKVFSLDGPVNGADKPTIAGLITRQDYVGFYSNVLRNMGFTISAPMLNSYFQRWQTRTAIDQTILNADTSGVYVPIGTDGDVAWDTPDLYLQSLVGQPYYPGLDSQLLYNPFPQLGQYGVLTGSDFETPTYPPDVIAAAKAQQWIVSHGYVMEEPCVISYLTAAVTSPGSAPPCLSGHPSSIALSSKTLKMAIPVVGNPPPMGTMSPTVASTGQTITITGSNFGASVGKVQFISSNSLDAIATISSWSNTSVRTTVPSNGTTGPVYLTTAGGARNPMGGITVLAAANGVSSLTVTPPVAPIDGQNATITVTAKNKSKQPVANTTIYLADGYGSVNALTNASGIATFSFPAYAGQGLVAFSGTASSAFQLTWQAPPTQNLLLTASATSLQAGQTSTLTAKVTNSTGGAVANQLVKFQLDGPATAALSASQATTNASGVAAVTATNASSGSAAVSAVTNYDFVTQGLTLDWSPTVTAISPAAGPSTGGTSVTITGTGFATGAVVYFGTTPSPSVSVTSATSITATSPSGSGTVDVTVSGSGVMSATNSADMFAFAPPPTVSGVSPLAGPTGGGTVVTISGTNFASGATVAFGTATATNVVVSSSTSISATSPAASLGTVDIVVTLPVAGSSTTSTADQFAYEAPPTVSATSPNAGPVSGGTAVTITGTNFVAGSSVSFGGVASTAVTVTSATSITATNPPMSSASVVDVAVTTPGGTSASSSSDQFAYGPPSVLVVSPTSGTTAGGTQVNINGTGFVPGVVVNFGSTQATSVTVSSSTSLTAVSPAAPAGTVDITIADPAGTSALTSNDQFTFQ